MRMHLIGIGGVGMAGLAVLLKRRGHSVTGCELIPSARTAWLEAQGIQVAIGHSPEHLENIDEVVVTPAVAADNPELVAVEAANLRVLRRGEVLAKLVSAETDTIAVAGSHGKTTTATWIARLLLALGENVEWAIGGATGSFPVAGPFHGADSNRVLVVEADESDGTLSEYHVKTLVVTNCEYDHAEHFANPEEYRECFDRARANAGEVIESVKLSREIVKEIPALAQLPRHNQTNARAAIEVALKRWHSLEEIAAELPAIVAELPDRRFQTVYPVKWAADTRGFTVIADYAHHPTEMRCAIAMARQLCRGKLRVLFQPHRYSRTKALLKDFPAAFEGADEVVLCPTYTAFEKSIEGGDVADLYVECRGKIAALYLARNCAEAWEHARNSMTAGDLTLLLGAGDIINLVPTVCDDCLTGKGSDPLLKRRIWIGQGTNTWKSDLNLSVEYVKTAGPAGAAGSTLGIPWMAGIPGTIGGWIKMNAGAFGHTISELVNRVKVDGRWLTAEECGFGYRKSSIEGEIEDVEFKAFPAKWEMTAEEYLAQRHKFPSGTKGSVFKNPEGDFAGRLLDEAGAKELSVGGARVWGGHANVIIAGCEATASDFLALAKLMRFKVWYRFGIWLESEVKGLDEF